MKMSRNCQRENSVEGWLMYTANTSGTAAESRRPAERRKPTELSQTIRISGCAEECILYTLFDSRLLPAHKQRLQNCLCITLGSDKRWLLFGCLLGTLVATTLLSWYLGYRTLRHIIGLHQPARQWLISYPVLTPAIVIASSSRLNSMCILRLRICGHEILDFPDSPDHRYFHFLRNSGVYHYWLEDIPHALVSIALLSYEYDQVETQEGAQSGIWADLPFGSRDVAFANLLMSALSIAFGLVSKMLQQLTLKVVVRTGEERTLRTSLLEVAADLSADGWTAAGLRAAAATPRGGAGGEAGASQGSE